MSESNAVRARRPAGLYVLGAALMVVQVIAVGGWALLGGEAPAGAASTSDGKVAVTYLVTGAAAKGNLTYTTPSGSEQVEAPLPFKTAFRIGKGGIVSLNATNPSDAGRRKITCTILFGGLPVKQSSATGSYSSASCRGVIGESEPLEGAKIPDTTPRARPGLAEGEVRLTKVVKVKRYAGAGSPVKRQVTDPDARLSYPELGGPWERSREVDPMLAGFSREQRFDTEPAWQGAAASGIADSDLMGHYKGRHRFRDLTSAIQDERQKYSFPDGTTGRDVASQPVKVGGRKGWVIVREMHFDKEGVRAKMDLSMVVVVDTGRPRPSYLWVDLPESHKKLWPDLNTMLKSLRTT